MKEELEMGAKEAVKVASIGGFEKELVESEDKAPQELLYSCGSGGKRIECLRTGYQAHSAEF